MRGVLLLAATLTACSYGSGPDRDFDFVLTFANGSDRLSAGASKLLDQASAAARAAPELDITVAGYADSPRTPESNQILSRLRAQAVADGLLARGVARDRITLSYRRGFGADPSDESRRVEIRLGS